MTVEFGLITPAGGHERVRDQLDRETREAGADILFTVVSRVILRYL
jgi:hypothetical protein